MRMVFIDHQLRFTNANFCINPICTFCNKEFRRYFWQWQRPLTSVHCSAGDTQRKATTPSFTLARLQKGVSLRQRLLAMMTNVPDNYQLPAKINSSNMWQRWVNVWLLCSESASTVSQRSLIANQISSPFLPWLISTSKVKGCLEQKTNVPGINQLIE